MELPADMHCKRCLSQNIRLNGTDLAARGRTQRYKCVDCGNRWRGEIVREIRYREGYLDIETDSAGRGAGNFGIMYSWAIKPRGAIPIDYDVLAERSLVAEKSLISNMIEAMKKYDRVYTYYGTGHDLPVARSRACYHALPFPPYMAVMHRDLYYVVRSKFKFHSNRMEAAAHFFGVSTKTELKPEIWVAAKFGDPEALKYILAHNLEDVKTLERLHRKIEPYFLGQDRSI